MPAYKAKFLENAIKSILSQTISDWELVIVDDCSPEDLKSVVDEFEDSRVRYYRNENNLGGANLVNQWNHSIGFANGDWIVLAADDDIYKPKFCEECMRLAEKYPQVDLIRTRVEQIDESGAHLWDDGLLNEYSDKKVFLHDWITAKAFTCIGNYAFRRSALEAAGGFIDFPCAFGSDVATPVALSVNGVANTSEMLFQFRQSAQHLSADSSRFKEKLMGITQLSSWLRSLDYIADVCSDKYLHDKCVYDYFNLVIKYLPLKKLDYLKYCTLATAKDKVIMFLRWIKRHLECISR